MGRYIINSMVLLSAVWSAWAEDIQLPEPEKTGGMPLMNALDARESNRTFSEKPLESQKLSNLLWAAFGISYNGRRTAPSAYNAQETDLYAALVSGVYVYRAESSLLKQVSDQDIREQIGGPKAAKNAPVYLLYVADYDRMKAKYEFYSATDTGFISQNVYLFCASEGLNTVVVGGANRETVRPLLNLTPSQHIILVQPVGYTP